MNTRRFLMEIKLFQIKNKKNKNLIKRPKSFNFYLSTFGSLKKLGLKVADSKLFSLILVFNQLTDHSQLDIEKLFSNKNLYLLAKLTIIVSYDGQKSNTQYLVLNGYGAIRKKKLSSQPCICNINY
ncbi:hypothetical protein BpHYR1_035905 [Brachionus plicatilis]|uniref:Uncharacterized protein n=1 Tax=Brachionus plicatilis TaxID=10195 RepID=A0A3M7SI34_BRAPC|nr:hypothetical protein BpHYR1_035905 [Brachionus plicatilis]